MIKQEELDLLLLEVEASNLTPRAKKIIGDLVPYMDESPSIRAKIKKILEIEKQLLEFEELTYSDLEKFLQEKLNDSTQNQIKPPIPSSSQNN